MCPPLIEYSSIDEYKEYYELYYCKSPIVTRDGIRVFFNKNLFTHAFYESSNRDGEKDVFSEKRSQRISWIKHTLEDAESIFYQGWDKNTKQYVPDRRVAVKYEDFVVVISLSLNKKGTLKANFITCYCADRSLEKIEESPIWTIEECQDRLKFGR